MGAGLMREIEFRGYCNKDFEWRHGSYVSDGESFEIMTLIDDHGGKAFYCSAVDPESVGQYSGLKDRNGVKIFEGDIVGAWVSGAIEITHEGEKMTAYRKLFCSKPRVVEFVRGSFRLNKPGHESENYYGIIDHNVSTNAFDLEVIGNIYQDSHLLENPELLEA